MPRKRIHLLFSANGEIKFTKQHFFVHIKHSVQFILLLLGIFFVVRYCIKVPHIINTKNYPFWSEIMDNKTLIKIHYNLYTSPGAKMLPISGELFCFTITNEKYHKDKVIAINNTWIQKCDHGEIYTESTTNLESNIPFTDLFRHLSKEYNHPFWRTLISLQYSYSKVSDKFNWYLKISDDTYLIVENLRNILKKYDSNKPYYMVLHSNVYLKEEEGSFVFSRKAIELLSKELHQNDSLCPYNSNEIIGIIECMRNIGAERITKIVKDSKGKKKSRDWNIKTELHFRREENKIKNFKDSFTKKRDGFSIFDNNLISLHHLTPKKLAKFKFDSIFDDFKISNCADECFLSTSKISAKSMTEALFYNVKNVYKLCENSIPIEECLEEKGCQSDLMSDTYMVTYKFICQKYDNDDTYIHEAFDKLKCLQNDANKLLVKCSNSCNVQNTFQKITNLDDDINMINFVNEEDKKILALPDLSPICQSSTCFLSCVGNNMNEKCKVENSSPLISAFNSLLKLEKNSLHGIEIRDIKSYYEYVIQTQCKNLSTTNDTVKIEKTKNLPSSVGKVKTVPVSLPSKNEECEGCGKDMFEYMYKKNSTEVLSTIMSQVRSSLDMIFLN
uniref:N-acetylgalactosaminide beta-1,3-galactosyltransferase n=1 Tax=Strongyloides stercoralis TaxID=6248 RepID=A0AAF5CRM0_STRER